MKSSIKNNSDKEQSGKHSVTIVISTEAPNEQENQTGVGDIDYAVSLYNELSNATSKMHIVYCQNNTKADLNTALENSLNTIFHLMINAPRTGFAISVDDLQNMREKNCKIVISAFEFAKYDEDNKRQTLAYLQQADAIIFLDELDKKEAVAFANLNGLELSFVDKILHAMIINVPPTINAGLVTSNKTDANIMCFGMLRTSKGFPSIIELAKQIKDNPHDYIKNKMVYVVGTVAKHKTKSNGTAYDPTLHNILCEMYPHYQDLLHDKSPQVLIDFYNNIKHEPPRLPIKLFIDTSEEKLASLFQQCEYAFYPADRGATLRNCSISTDFAFGCIIYSHLTEITPELLKMQGKYGKSLVLLPNDNPEVYASALIRDLEIRELNKQKQTASPTLNTITRQYASNLLKEELSLTNFVAKHLQLYSQLLGKPLANLKSHNLLSKFTCFFGKRPAYEKIQENSCQQITLSPHTTNIGRM